MQLAHRVSWILAYGEIPEGKSVLHRCDNPTCVRPSHLFLGTQADNVRDMCNKGRAVNPAGEDQGRAKLTAVQVACIRLLAQFGLGKSPLGRMFRVHSRQIDRIVRGQQWRVS